MPELFYNNKKIFYTVSGRGRAVMLLHGFGEDGRVWEKQEEKLKENYKVIVPDLPGSGKSEELEGTYSIQDYAEVIKAIADKEMEGRKQKTFSLIGHSMGGYITLAFAEKYPSMLNSFGLFHSTAFADTIEKAGTRKKAISFIQANGKEAFLKTSVPDLFTEATQKENPAMVEKLLSIANVVAADALIQYYEAMIMRPERLHVLSSFPRPVLLIFGKEDKVVPMKDALYQSHLPAISVLHILKSSAHMGMWEEEELSSQFLLEFLKNLPEE
jgi:pimeloyl-ACP methyl ester carboxylesterase